LANPAQIRAWFLAVDLDVIDTTENMVAIAAYSFGSFRVVESVTP